MDPQPLTILFLRDGELTVARCLEYDIAAQGRNYHEALRAWGDVFAAQIIVDLSAGRQPLAGVRPAPEEYFANSSSARRR